MAWRQECCSGVLVGFFVVALDESNAKEDQKLVAGGSMVEPYAAAVPHANFTAMWSQFHNVDYAATAIERLNIAASKWTEDAKGLIMAEGYMSSKGKDKKTEDETQERRAVNYTGQAFRLVEVNNPELPPRKKRGAEAVEEKVVNKMVPRKKVKKVVE